MASTKDTFEPNTFEANTFAAGAFRGTGVTVNFETIETLPMPARKRHVTLAERTRHVKMEDR